MIEQDKSDSAEKAQYHKVTPMRAIKAKCKDCMANYCDGRRDCGVPSCPLYTFMPYRDAEPKILWARKREMTDKQKKHLEHMRELGLFPGSNSPKNQS
jgi:hypothetical protein